MNKNFEGVYAVAVTPFKENGEFDFEAAKKHLDWLIAEGIKGICILGATGEYQSVSNEEHKQYVREIAPYICDRVSVLVGATRERPEDVVDLMENAKKYGVKAAMVLPPFYCHPHQDEIYSHFEYINDHCDLPMIVYNNPGSAGVDIESETFEEILKLKNSLIVKESTGDIKRLTEVLIQAPDTTSVFCGCDNMAYESILDGAHGWVSMTANFAPKDCVALYENIVYKKDYASAFEIYKRLLPSLNTLESFPKPAAAIKCILTECRGIPAGFMRRPRKELTADEKAYVLESMKADSIG